MSQYSYLNAEPVLEEVEKLIAAGYSCKIKDVCHQLAIFDWWNDTLSVSKMKEMRTFLRTAIDLGFTGKVSFKVGAHGCSNGMWAHRDESTDGYDPDGDVLYRSFSPDYTYWDVNIGNKWLRERYPELEYDEVKTVKRLKELI